MNPLIENLNLWGARFVQFASPMLWQSSLLIVALFALDFALRRKVRAVVRYALWLIVLVKLLLPPTLAIPTGIAWWLRPAPPAPNPEMRRTIVSYGEFVAPPAPMITLPPTPMPPPKLSLAGGAVAASVAISVGLLAWMILRWRHVVRVVRAASPATEGLNDLLDDCRRNLGLRREVRLRLTDLPMSPAVCGLFRPVILLPRSLAEQLPPDQLRAVLLHELVHLKHGDVWVNCAQALIQIAYWWNPLVWLANARIRRVREEAVDDAVMLALREDAETYAPTLLEVAKLAFHRPLASLGIVGIIESRNALRQRIERLVDFRPPRKAGLTIVSTLCVVAFAALAVPMEKAPPTSGKPSSTKDKRDSSGTISSVPVFSNSGRKAIVSKLDQIRLDFVFFEELGLGEVVQLLTDEAQKRDPEGKGIDFRIDPNAVAPIQAAEQIDPTTGLPVFAGGKVADLRSLPITINPTLTDVRLADVLEAIVKAAGDRIKYSIEEYAVVFSQKGPELEPLITRTFQLDPNSLYKALERTSGVSFADVRNTNGEGAIAVGRVSADRVGGLQFITRTNSMQHVSVAIATFFNTLGVDLASPDAIAQGKAVFWSNRGGLLVRATKADLDAIERALADLEAKPAKSGLAAGPAAPLPSSSSTAELRAATNPIPQAWALPKPAPTAKADNSTNLFVRTYRVDSNTFYKGLENFSPLPVTRSNVNSVVREFFTTLGVSLYPPKSVFFNDRSGDLLIRATSQDFDMIEAAVEVLNRTPAQVNIQVRFVEIAAQDNRAGFDWLIGKMLLKNGATNIVTKDGVPQFTGILTDGQYRVVLNALKEQKDAEVLATQEVTTFSGRQAQVQTVELRTIVNGNNLPLPALPGHAATNSGANSSYQTQVLPFGPVLDVIPHVSADGYTVQMTVIPTVTEFLGYDDPAKALSSPRTAPKDGGVLPLPRMRVRQMTASAIVWDGQTLVLGCSTGQSFAKKPDGTVERKDFAGTKRKQLLVFVTPTIVDAGGNRLHLEEDEFPLARKAIPPQTPRK